MKSFKFLIFDYGISLEISSNHTIHLFPEIPLINIDLNEHSMHFLFLSKIKIFPDSLLLSFDDLKNNQPLKIVQTIQAGDSNVIGENIFKDEDFDEERQERFEEMLDMANEAQSAMINGVIKVLEKEKKDRFYNAYDRGVIEMPIVVKFTDINWYIVKHCSPIGCKV